MLDVFVLHDSNGRIVAVGHTPSKGRRTVELRPRVGRAFLRLTMPEGSEPMLARLHQTHEVDLGAKALRERPVALR